jgi:hypothetical protein
MPRGRSRSIRRSRCRPRWSRRTPWRSSVPNRSGSHAISRLESLRRIRSQASGRTDREPLPPIPPKRMAIACAEGAARRGRAMRSGSCCSARPTRQEISAQGCGNECRQVWSLRGDCAGERPLEAGNGCKLQEKPEDGAFTVGIFDCLDKVQRSRCDDHSRDPQLTVIDDFAICKRAVLGWHSLYLAECNYYGRCAFLPF